MSFDGLLNATCSIWKVSLTENSTTGQQADSYAVKYASVKCRLDQADGGSYLAPQRIKEKATHVLFLPFTYDVQETDQIRIGAITYTVLLVANAGGQGHHQELFLEYVR